LEAARRLARREPVVRRTRDDGAKFVMSLAAGDAVQFPAGVKIVQGVWAAGVIVTLAHNDAAGTSVWRPSPGTLVTNGAKKISIDPIGRIRAAGD
jgi:CRISPR-associated endonuclease Csn1